MSKPKPCNTPKTPDNATSAAPLVSQAGAEATSGASCLPARSLKSSTRIIASNMASLK